MNPRNNEAFFLYITVIMLSLIYIILFLDVSFNPNSFIFKLSIIYLILCNLLTFYRCSLIDPGFINENKHPTFDLQPLYFKNTVDVMPDALENSRRIRFVESDGSTKTYIQKYCTTCNIFRPHKAAHCNDCGRCILEKDHHCIWLSNCIGRNNSKMFYCFIFTLTILSIRSAFIMKYLCDTEREMFYTAILRSLFYNSIVLSAVLFTFTAYNTFLAFINIKSRVFINSQGKIMYKIDFKKIMKRLCTIKPAIISSKSYI